ncbi:hypothetical protein [Jiulongibacter sediminis]|jgi:hypothetical protein|uniref:hypothetical protein n=1 Tax=Jiulongibacter sediminis TaxID=1605367 RepID=UPI0026EDEA59|nr:hypothetical protein [Jiulongibacter sediminis]
MDHTAFSRRNLLKTSLAGFALPGLGFLPHLSSKILNPEPLFVHYPNLEPDLVSEVVGASHFDFDKVKMLVDRRPELAAATWEWRFGDFESALGAASHVGRRDIAEYLISKGARPNIFSFAMLGAFEVVKSMIEFSPGLQRTTGPHGISLFRHAKTGLRNKDQMTTKEFDKANQLVDYLESLGDANGPNYLNVTEEEQKLYMGDYRYGEGKDEGFSVKINMQKLLSLAPLGGFGGSIYKVGENLFIYNGAPSVKISFDISDGVVQSLTVRDPDYEVTAQKVN